MRCAVCAQHIVAALMVHQKSHGCFELLKILGLLYAHNVVAIGNVVLRLSGDSYRQHKQLKYMHACMHRSYRSTI